jgi:hypothetical protein
MGFCTQNSINAQILLNKDLVRLVFPKEIERSRFSSEYPTHFLHAVGFAIFERLEVTGRREVGEGTWKKTVADHAPTGRMELRVGDFTYGQKLRDRKSEKLESLVAKCVATLMSLGRDQFLAAEAKRLREIEFRRRQEELWKLSEEIRKEDECVKWLEGWVTAWSRAREIREFVAALEALWSFRGEDVSESSPRGQRLKWMRQQADQLDSLVESPPSVLDRRHEIQRW